jgi:hypothetical protein
MVVLGEVMPTQTWPERAAFLAIVFLDHPENAKNARF